MVGTTQVTTVTMEQGSGPERYRNQNEPTRLATFMDIANALAHISMGFVAVGAFFVAMAFAKSSFTIHIYLCVTGYVLLMALGILSISPHTGWARTLSYQQRKSVHLALLVSGSTLAIAGSVYRMVNYSPIFNTAHGITGTFAMVFTMLNLIGGLINHCANCSQVFRTLHKVCGILIMFLAYLALILAFTNVYRQLTSSSHANLMICFTVLAMLTTLSSACGNLFKRFF